MDLETKEDKGQHNEKGFYCEVCDCIVKDSLNYLDHKNGRRHNKNLGISLKKFTDSTLEEVKEMLELKRREKYEADNPLDEEGEDDEDEDEAERLRRKKREKKKRQKARKAESLYY